LSYRLRLQGRPVSRRRRFSQVTIASAFLAVGGCIQAAGEEDGGTGGKTASSSAGQTASGSSTGSGSAVSASTGGSTLASTGSGSSGSSPNSFGSGTAGSTGTSSGFTATCVGEPGGPCLPSGTCEWAPSSPFKGPSPGDGCADEYLPPPFACAPSGVAGADAGLCNASAGSSSSDLLCPQCEICAPRESTFPAGDCRPYLADYAGGSGYVTACTAELGVWSGQGGGPPPAGLVAAPIVIAQGLQENDLDELNRALYQEDLDAGCAIGFEPGLFLWCSGGGDSVNPWGDCGVPAAGWQICGCPAQCHYAHCVLPCNPDNSCPDAGVPTTCSNGFCYESCQTNVDCHGSYLFYTCYNGLCMNPDAGA
jgi:hypothetical protein